MNFKSPRYILLYIFVLTVIVFIIDLPRIPVKFKYKDYNVDTEIGGYQLDLFNGKIRRDLDIKQGLDIAGGVSILLDADMSGIAEEDRVDALQSLTKIIERRVNLLGISESSIQTSRNNNNYRVIVDLAGVFDTTQALNTIGAVAQLEFKLENTDAPTEITLDNGETQQINPGIPTFDSIGLTGADLKKASIVFNQSGSGSSSSPEVELQFNLDGTKIFGDVTTNNVGKRIAIYLDDNILMAPTVNTPITNGRAVVTGNFTLEEAQSLVTQLNAGALPVPVKVIEQRTVGPSLGQESVRQSIYAGLVGLSIVILFMITSYGSLGILASISLFIYALITLALYKIIPVVLTLPGLAGFILSIGMAVDANILIFERIKEEIRAKKPLSIALENGFGRSWDSIRDANTATLLTAFILFNPFGWSFLPISGPVRGFALTLALGIFISLFTGVFVTRNLVRVFYKRKIKS